MNDFQQLVIAHILDEAHFVAATFSGQQHGQTLPWKKVRLRPVLVKQKRHVQISYFDGRQDITKNYRGAELENHLIQLVEMPFSHFQVQAIAGDLQVQITKKGKAIVHHSAAQRTAPDLSHDRKKQVALPAGSPDPFLQAVGIMTADSKIKADMHAKYRQINEFLRLVQETDKLDQFENIFVVDCGCGSAYLTFAIHYYLNQHVPTRTVGVDVRAGLLRNHTQTAERLGWHDIRFETSTIIDFQPDSAPDIVLALHACDTATDEALAQAIWWGSPLIFSVPCCHHHLQAQLEGRQIAPFEPVLRHGILKERLGDILTDAFRALILRIMGYQTQVIEFISTEHTAKNLMIRAVKSTTPGDPQFVREYEELKNFWQVTPYLETLLGQRPEFF
jgi:hypothetical protein